MQGVIKKQFVKLYLLRYRIPRDMIREAFSRYAERTAIISNRGQLTYRELEERVNSLVQGLEKAGIDKGARVFTLLPDGWEQIEIRLASYESGFILTSFHSEHSPQALLSAAKMASPAAFIFDPLLGTNMFQELQKSFPEIVAIPTRKGNLYEKLIEENAALRSRQRITPSDPASLGFTSGTTGEPKALFTTHKVLVTSLKLTAINVSVTPSQQDRFVLGIPLVGAGGGVVLPMLFSGSVLILPEAYKADSLLSAFRKNKATRTFLTPSLLIDFLDIPEADLSMLWNVIYGTAPIPVPKLEEAIRRWGPIFQQGYGMAEVLPPVSLLQMRDHGTKEKPAPRDILRSVGKVVPEVKVKIVNQNGVSKPQGEIGEVIIDSPTTFNGYWQKPDLNELILRKDWYYTRDLGFIDQAGWLHVLGRKVDVITRDQNQIFPLIIEEAAHEHPGVKEACLVENKKDQKLILVVSLRKSWKASINEDSLPQDILVKMGENIPKNHLPDQVQIRDELPRSYLAKVLHREVRESLSRIEFKDKGEIP